MRPLNQLRKGSTTILVLSTLSDTPKYGYQIMREIEERSDGYFTMTAALLYPALHKLEKEGLIEGEWQAGVGKRRRKYYTITQSGAQALGQNLAAWQEFVGKLFETVQAPPNLVGGEA
ncbi:MAG: PadR family transcriptional regulator [Candidatus Promineifilaceae bacterium]